jgi:hypothetical protein
MSDVIYPLGLIADQTVQRTDRTIRDEFESGATSARALWAANSFKRRVSLQHSPLTFNEFQTLRAFHTSRSGMYDTFWFRDNVNRSGNIKSRFANPLQIHRGPAVYDLRIELEETAPIRGIPELTEITTAAGTLPAIWWDANREIYISHMSVITKDAAAYDVGQKYAATWQNGGGLNLGNAAAQYQHYLCTATEWAKTTPNITELVGAQPATTVLAITQQAAAASKQIIAAIGAMGAGAALGIAISAANQYEPWIGGAETWAGAQFTNSAASTWRSVAVTWAAASNSATLYVNAASIGSASNTRSLTAGPATLGAAIDGTLKLSGQIAHLLVFPAALSLAQVKAVHNLLAYQYGMALVA